MTDGYQKIEKLMREVYLIDDPGIIKLLCAVVIANRMPFDPVWLFLIAPSGGGKTELISAVNDVIGIYPISSLTSHTFISGLKKKGQETSLLFKIQQGIVTFKDFTSILNINQEERKDIMGQLREIYDGSYVKHFGTGEEVRWKGKIGMIAGVTTVIYVARDLYAAMGERFIMYSLVVPDREEIAERAMRNVEIIQDKRDEIRLAFHSYLDEELGIPSEVPTINEELFQEIKHLAEFSTRARSPVERDFRSSTKEITFVHTPEMPTRFAAQLISLAKAFMMMNRGEIEDMDKQILYKIALDSITSTRRKAMQEAARHPIITTAGLATKANYPTQTVRRWLEDLNALEVMDRIKKGSKDEWKIKEKYRKLIERFEGIQVLDTDLTEMEAERYLSVEASDSEALLALIPEPEQSEISFDAEASSYDNSEEQ